VSVIDTSTNTVVATLSVSSATFASGPLVVAAAPDGKRVYLSNCAFGPVDSCTISVIETATNTVTNNAVDIPVKSMPFSMAVTPNGAYLYTANLISNTVSVVSTATNTVVGTIPVGSQPAGIAFTPDGAYAYVANTSGNTVSVISTLTNTVVATIPVGTTPDEVAITPDGAYAYVSNNSSQDVSVISTHTNTVIASIPFPSVPEWLAVTPNGAFVYVPVGHPVNTVFVVATATNTVVASIPISPYGNVGGPVTVAFTADGAFAYVTGAQANEVFVINTATNTVVATVPVGISPYGVVIAGPVGPLYFSIQTLIIDKPGFYEQGRFRLGEGSKGINPVTAPVAFRFGTASIVIAPGSFHRLGSSNNFWFVGNVNGVSTFVDIQAQDHDATRYKFAVSGWGLDLASQAEPMKVGLQIGDNTGSTTFKATVFP